MALVENDPSSRMQQRSLGELMHPGSCCVCGNGNSEQTYLELGVFFDYEGNLYLCTPCVEQVINVWGAFTAEEMAAALEGANANFDSITRLEEELANVNEQLSAARTLLAANHSAYLSVVAPDTVSEESEPKDSVSAEPVSVPDEGKPEVKEPVSEPRRGNTSSTKSSNRKFT